MLFLRQSTASQEILLGPFVDSTDGNTAETGLTIANTDIKLWIEGGTTLTDKNSGGATHISNGYYYAVLDATDTATIGKLEVNVKVSGALAVRREYQVLDEAVYDSLNGTAALITAGTGTGQLSVSSGQVILQTGTGTGQLDFTSGVVKSDVSKWLGTAASTPTVAGVPNVNVKTWNDLTTVALPLVPTTAGRTLDVSVGGEAGVDWANVGSPTTVVGLSGTTVKTATDVETDTADIQSRLPAALTAGGNIKADALAINAVATTSVTTINANVGTTNAINFDGSGASGYVKADMRTVSGTAQSGGDLSANQDVIYDKVVDVETDTQNIQSRIPAALTAGGNIKADELAINGSTTAATRLALSAAQIIPGTVDTVTNTHTPTTTEFQADDITETTPDHFNGRVVIFTSGALANQATSITDYVAVGGIGQFTVVAMTEAPANNDTFIIV